jgi:hypothetical protein
MQEAFRDEGIEFAHRNVTVYVPSKNDETESGEQKDVGTEIIGTSDKKLIEKAGAAAITAVPADEDAKTTKK